MLPVFNMARAQVFLRGSARLAFPVFVLASAIAMAGTTALGLGLVTPRYSATLVVGPTARMGAAAIGARLPNAGLGALASVTEPGPADEQLSDFSRYLQLLRSVPVAERLMGTPGVPQRLFADRWDAARGEWRAPTGVWAGLRAATMGLAGRRSWAVPDAVALAGELGRRVTIDSVGTGPMRRVTFRDPDRAFALALLGMVADAADARLRDEAGRRARAQIDHVRRALAVGNTAGDHKRALVDLLAEEERVLMVLEVDLPFAADTIEPVHAAALPDWPDVPMIAAAAGLATIAAGAAWWGWRRPVERA